MQKSTINIIIIIDWSKKCGQIEPYIGFRFLFSTTYFAKEVPCVILQKYSYNFSNIRFNNASSRTIVSASLIIK